MNKDTIDIKVKIISNSEDAEFSVINESTEFIFQSGFNMGDLYIKQLQPIELCILKEVDHHQEKYITLNLIENFNLNIFLNNINNSLSLTGFLEIILDDYDQLISGELFLSL